jgi:hypothetical protein
VTEVAWGPNEKENLMNKTDEIWTMEPGSVGASGAAVEPLFEFVNGQVVRRVRPHPFDKPWFTSFDAAVRAAGYWTIFRHGEMSNQFPERPHLEVFRLESGSETASVFDGVRYLVEVGLNSDNCVWIFAATAWDLMELLGRLMGLVDSLLALKGRNIFQRPVGEQLEQHQAAWAVHLAKLKPPTARAV